MGPPPPPSSHIVETIIVHVPKHSDDVARPEGQLCLRRDQEAGVSLGRPCHLPPSQLGSLSGSSPPRPCWGSSPGGCSQMQPPWSGELSGWQGRPAAGGLEGEGQKTQDFLSGHPSPPAPAILHTGGLLNPTHYLYTSCSPPGGAASGATPQPPLHKAEQGLPTPLPRESACKPRPLGWGAEEQCRAGRMLSLPLGMQEKDIQRAHQPSPLVFTANQGPERVDDLLQVAQHL